MSRQRIDLYNSIGLLVKSNYHGHARILAQHQKILNETEQEELIRNLSNYATSDHVDLSAISRPLAIFKGKMLGTMHFQTNLSSIAKQHAFKAGVNYIDVETSSQCNRICNYCPNSIHDRRTSNSFMEWDVYEKLIKELAEISYSETLNFVGYNEPLMHKEDLIDRVSRARELLPGATLNVFSNGDYLSREVVDRLHLAGVDALVISVHMAPNASYKDGEVLERIAKTAKVLQLTAHLREAKAGSYMNFDLVGAPIKIAISQANYNEVGHYRGGSVETVLLPKKPRTAACSLPFNQFIIAHNGNVLPCCTLVGDIPEHSSHVVGNIEDQSIFDIYSGESYVKWRTHTLNLREKQGPCKYCSGEQSNPEHVDTLKLAPVEKFLGG